MLKPFTVLGVIGSLLFPVLAADLPRQAPDFKFKMPNGQEASLGQYKGKVVALEFLLTTCPHCQQTSMLMERLQKEYGPRGFQALGVAINDPSGALVRQYIQQYRLTYPVGFSTNRDAVVGFLQHPVMMSLMMPQLVFIDRNGNIQAQYAGTDDFFKNEEKNVRQQITNLLNSAGKSTRSQRKKGS